MLAFYRRFNFENSVSNPGGSKIRSANSTMPLAIAQLPHGEVLMIG